MFGLIVLIFGWVEGDAHIIIVVTLNVLDNAFLIAKKRRAPCSRGRHPYSIYLGLVLNRTKPNLSSVFICLRTSRTELSQSDFPASPTGHRRPTMGAPSNDAVSRKVPFHAFQQSYWV
ncbi:MAG: hypothetical protein ABI155_09895, partial [Paralcaligenes sp.]